MAADGFFLTGAATRVAAGAMARTAGIASECASTISVTGRPRSGKASDENTPTPFVLWHSGIQIASSWYGSTSTVTMGNRKCCLPGVGWLVSASCLSFGLKNGSLNQVMGQNGVQTKLCVRKTIVDSSIQAKCIGNFMRQKWRIMVIPTVQHMAVSYGGYGG